MFPSPLPLPSFLKSSATLRWQTYRYIHIYTFINQSASKEKFKLFWTTGKKEGSTLGRYQLCFWKCTGVLIKTEIFTYATSYLIYDIGNSNGKSEWKKTHTHSLSFLSFPLCVPILYFPFLTPNWGLSWRNLNWKKKKKR